MEHIAHLARRNESLQAKVDKLKAKGARVAQHATETLEILAGAAIGGALQGMAKDQEHGPRIAHVPADLAIGLTALVVGSGTDLAGEYGKDVANLGKGFLAAYATDFGHAIGTRKRVTGSFFPKKGAPHAIAGASPQAMADAVLQQMQG